MLRFQAKQLSVIVCSHIAEASRPVLLVTHEDGDWSFDGGLDVILTILGGIEPKPQNPLFQVLAAGPLENLLGQHGEVVIERIEDLAKQEPRMGLLLGGVWQGRMSAGLWSRIQQCRPGTW